MKDNTSFKKITVIGAGAVGSTTAFALIQANVVDEIAIIDIAEDKVAGDVLDLTDAAAFSGSTKVTGGNDYTLCNDSEIIIITAGAAQKPGETRLDLVRKNAGIMKSIVSEIIKHNTTALLIIVSNPVDILATVALRVSGFAPEKVIGTGTLLDTGRARAAIAEKLGLYTNQVEAYVLGEHGDSQFIPWSLAQVEDKESELASFSEDVKKTISDETKQKAYTIIGKKGATYYGIASAVELLVSHILDEGSEPLPLSTYQKTDDGKGFHITCALSCVTKDGVTKTAVPDLTDGEVQQLANSVDGLKKVLDSIEDIV